MVRFRLSRRGRRALERFVGTTKDKVEYIRGTALLMRGRGKKVKEVSKELGVSMGAVFKWQRMYRKKNNGLLDGLKRRKQTGRPPINGEAARKAIPDLMKKDPEVFGFLKGRRVLRDISKALKSEGIDMGPSQVHGILHELGLSYKRPKLTVESTAQTLSTRGRKEREVNNYKKIAPALQKRGLW
jgi:transposase